MSNKINIKNKRAKFDYEFLESYTAGIQLNGTEIKSIRDSKASIAEAFCVVIKSEVYIRNMYIAPYKNAGFTPHEERRDRKLLLNRTEINKIEKKLKNQGLTLIPYTLFISDKGYAKVTIKLAKGKKTHDKREDLKAKDAKREMDRRMKY
ncbi:SsrA-binding protein SmpB [Parvicella tangerina]|uniref:SsrA-binding protein n=1 Tax=Parvicella tangerina TaxID=2829795 RepID=A0A916JMC3_9FLAO|nr:SsrA-binding protein SmpB [Parvicella tangerina]CAG5081760.1 SsrA-binding protein [Parvicella tangerina]